jgi:negative regulator of sigma E activity
MGQKMTKYQNQQEQITAFLDGQMDDADMTNFEAAMNTDPALADAVARYGANDDLLRGAFDAPIQQGVDDALLAKMGLAEIKTAQVVDISVARKSKTAANDDSPGWRRWRWPAAGSIAAAMVAAVMLQTSPISETGAKFAEAMETLPSGQIAQLAKGETVEPLLTFQAGDGRFCREFSRSGAQSATGVACRGDGGWAVVANAKGATSLSNTDQIEMAAGADGSALADEYARLKASDPLDSEAEKALIANGWMSGKK